MKAHILSMHKTNALALLSNKGAGGRCRVAIAAQLCFLQRNKSSTCAHKCRCAIAVVVCGVCMEIARHFWLCLLNAVSAVQTLWTPSAHIESTVKVQWKRLERAENRRQELCRNAIKHHASNAMVAVRTLSERCDRPFSTKTDPNFVAIS